jgi:hypothetical protein
VSDFLHLPILFDVKDLHLGSIFLDESGCLVKLDVAQILSHFFDSPAMTQTNQNSCLLGSYFSVVLMTFNGVFFLFFWISFSSFLTTTAVIKLEAFPGSTYEAKDSKGSSLVHNSHHLLLFLIFLGFFFVAWLSPRSTSRL